MAFVLAGEAWAERRVALVIGNSDYRRVPKLANPTNDATLMAQALEEVGFEVIAETNADRRTMARAIKAFGRTLRAAGPETVGLFFYAGHGVQASGANYLLPLTAEVVDEADLEIEAVSAQWVLSQMESAGNALNMVILDACRNNPYRGSFRAATRGLARMDAPSGSLVAYSAGPGKVAHDGIGRNSPYTAALAAAMTKPGLDIEDVFKTVRRSVEAETNGGQTPWEESSLKGDFYFVPQGSTVTVTPPQAAPAFDARAVELAFWNSIAGSGNVAMFEEYKRRYPEGTFTGLADLKIKELTAEEQTAALPPPATPTPEEIERGLGLSREERKLIQRALNDLKHEAGVDDGIFGSRTRKAIRAWQVASNTDATSHLTGDQAKALIARGREVQVAVGTYETPTPPTLNPGDTFHDCPECPEMVVVPAGSFLMGSPESENRRDEDEGPQHRVRIPKPFAVGRFEVTFAEWDACVADGGCNGYRPDDQGWGRGNRPVINVSWEHAKAYVRWLSRETEKSYRLLSEAEWEYVARAGTTTPFHTGRTITTDRANFDGNYTYNGSAKGQYRKRTTSVGIFASNRFGLHDVHGNVWEWTEDCWNDSYAGAPDDGAPWTRGDCSRRVLRGGSWYSEPGSLRSANRGRNTSDDRSSSSGFRIARTLTP